MSPLQPTALQPIAPSWLSRPAVEVAPDLLGCRLVRRWPDGRQLATVIVETEAYTEGDPACHAYRRETPRNRVMFGPAGYSYVYLIYGIYHCFNVVTDRDRLPSAVLIRAVELETVPDWLPRDRRDPPQRWGLAPANSAACWRLIAASPNNPFTPTAASG